MATDRVDAGREVRNHRVDVVLQDNVDAMIADLPACIYAVRRHPDRGLYALVTPLTYEPIGIALSGSDALLVNWTQNWLRELEATGALERTTDRWFKDTAWLGRLP